VLPSRLVGRQAAAGVEYRTSPGLVAAQPAEYRRGSARQRWLRWQPRAGSAGLVTFAVLGLFEWDDGKDDDDETEDDKKSRSGGSSSSPLPRVIVDPEQEELRRILLEEPGKPEDSVSRTMGDWWDSMVSGQNHTELRHRGRKGRNRAEMLERRERFREQDRRAMSARGWKEADPPEDAMGGVMTVLNSVKTSVFAAILGTPGSTSWGSPGDEAPQRGRQSSLPPQLPKEKPQLSMPELSMPALPQMPQLPSTDGWLESARGAADAAAAAVAGVTSQGTPKQSEEVTSEEQDWWESARSAVMSIAPREESTSQQAEQQTVSPPAETSGPLEPDVSSNPTTEPNERPPPDVPGMEDANLTVRVDIEPKKVAACVGAKAVAKLMSSADSVVLGAMAQSGWEMETIDESKGLYMVSMPSVRYELPGGVISIPAPRFLTTFYDTRGSSNKVGSYQERAQGDMVLENGEGIFQLELGFPFRTTFSISCSGWTRACIGWDGEQVLTSNYVELGIQVPKVPGLSSMLEYFVKSYGSVSTTQCAAALAGYAERMPMPSDPEPAPFVESAEAAEVAESAEIAASTEGAAVMDSVNVNRRDKADEAGSVDNASKVPGETEEELGKDTEWWESARDAVLSAKGSIEALAKEEESSENEPELADPDYLPPPPEVPGMDKANLIVRVDIDSKKAFAKIGGQEGVERLMARSDQKLFETMAQTGWTVETLNESKGQYMLSLPSVRYEIMGAVISIPSPKFATWFRDTRGKSNGAYKERAQGDLVLQNGENLFTIELGWPFSKTLKLSGAGWTRATIGWDGDAVITTNYVEIGIQLPKVPGLSAILEYFVKNYGNESTLECAAALARGADSLPKPEPSPGPSVILEDSVLSQARLDPGHGHGHAREGRAGLEHGHELGSRSPSASSSKARNEAEEVTLR